MSAVNGVEPLREVASLRRLTASDVLAVARLQSGLLQNSAITQLGVGFLVRFYRVALAAGCEAFVACDADGRVIGAALATEDIARFNAYVTPRIALRLLASLSRRWALAFRFLRGCFERKPSRHVAAELLLLFVDGSRQRGGTGKRLVQAVEDAFARRGVIEYRVSLRSEIRGAQAFYAAIGFQYDDELIVLGRPMTYLKKQIR